MMRVDAAAALHFDWSLSSQGRSFDSCSAVQCCVPDCADCHCLSTAVVSVVLTPVVVG